MAEIEKVSSSTDSLTLRLCKLQTSWSQGIRTTSWQIGNLWAPGEDIPNNAEYGGEVTFSGLDADTEYYVVCEVYHGSTLLSTIDGYVTTDADEGGWEEPDEPTVDIAKWSWYASNGTNASAIETFTSYATLTKGSPTESFYHTVWNDMVEKAWEIIKASTNWWDSTYGSLDDTKFYSEPYELTADMFNSLRNNIELVGNGYLGIGRTGIPRPVYSYDSNYPVKASYFTTLTDYMNECIDNL